MIQEEINFRKAELLDLPFLYKLRIETMDAHLKNDGRHLTKEQHEGRVLHEFDNAKIILKNNQEIGLLKMKELQDGYEIIQFQIGSKHQGVGIGKSILDKLIQKANKENASIKLSVLKNNKARFLYKKVGFVKVGESEDSFFMCYNSDRTKKTS